MTKKKHVSRSHPEYVQVVKPVVNYFERILANEGWCVIAQREESEDGQILQGTDEFGIFLDARMQVDVLAFKWDTHGRIVTKAVEAKIAKSVNTATSASSPARSVDEALGQAASYQILFDQVYIATPNGDMKHRESTLSDLVRDCRREDNPTTRKKVRQ